MSMESYREGFSNRPPFNQSNNPANRSQPSSSSSAHPEPAFHIPEADQAESPKGNVEPFNMKNALNDVNEWANQRVAIFSALDAALSKAVVEAVSALSELKQRAEDEARATTASIMAERDSVQQQLEALRLEQARLQNQVAEDERRLENLEVRRIAAEREINQLLEKASRERTQLQVEVDRLKARTRNMNEQLQTFFQQRFSELWEQFSKTAGPSQTTVVPNVEEIFGKDFEPSMLWPEINPEPATESQISKVISQQEFEDAPTPKANIIPIKPEDFTNLANAVNNVSIESVENKKVEDKPEEAVETEATIAELEEAAPVANPPTADPLAPLERVVFNQEKEIELDESDFVKLFNKAKRAKANRKPLETTEAAPIGPTPTQQQRQVTHQQVERILRKRKPRTNRTANQAASAVNNIESAKAQPVAKEKVPSRTERERQVYEELGGLLGVDITTPPQSSQMMFAEGFTPPPDLSNQWFAMANQVEKVAPPLPPVVVGPSSPKTPPERNFGDEPPSVTLDDIFSSFPADLPIEDEEAELSPIDEISPTIGELGPDFAWHWHDDDLKAAEAKNWIEPAKPSPNLNRPPEINAMPSYMSMARPDIAAQIFEDFPDFSLVPPPPPRGATIVSDSDTGQVTKILVSNLQGLSLLNIERVVRGLPGVYQVVVTTLEKGEIGMEVRHHPELELDKVLPNLPDFKLRLIESGENLLKFVQVR